MSAASAEFTEEVFVTGSCVECPGTLRRGRRRPCVEAERIPTDRERGEDQQSG
ncbi:MAG: hypothetical protein MSC30_09850 [Gaiellaceae bacterium MAG52_C11]|nr:hypothetical protein [Candidatus Gaiellasilicea maunaloa]